MVLRGNRIGRTGHDRGDRHPCLTLIDVRLAPGAKSGGRRASGLEQARRSETALQHCADNDCRDSRKGCTMGVSGQI